MTDSLNLKPRIGEKPETTSKLPHAQRTDHGPDDVIKKLHAFCFSLPGVNNKQSGISVPGARALVMDSTCACNPKAFMIGREFAHIHPSPDNGSMHIQLPKDDALEVIAKGWGEDHYLVTLGHLPQGLVLLFSPRNDDELEIIKTIVLRGHSYACKKEIAA